MTYTHTFEYAGHLSVRWPDGAMYRITPELRDHYERAVAAAANAAKKHANSKAKEEAAAEAATERMALAEALTLFRATHPAKKAVDAAEKKPKAKS